MFFLCTSLNQNEVSSGSHSARMLCSALLCGLLCSYRLGGASHSLPPFFRCEEWSGFLAQRQAEQDLWGPLA